MKQVCGEFRLWRTSFFGTIHSSSKMFRTLTYCGTKNTKALEMATITTGVYRHLKDRSRPLCDKLKLVRLVWKSKRAFLQNKEQVLLDFLSGLILNKKKLKLQEDDVVSIWKTLCDLLQTSLVGRKSKIIIKPSMCQIINESIAVKSVYQEEVVLCCLQLLQSPALSHVYSKYEQLSILLSKLLQMVDSFDSISIINENVWMLLQVVLKKYQEVQSSHTNQKMVYQNTTDKLLLTVLTLWHRTRNTDRSVIGDDTMNLLINTLFTNDHEKSYSVFIHSISPDVVDKPQTPKYLENFFSQISGCLKCKSLQTGVSPDRLQSAILHFIPIYFKELVTTNKITDCSTVKNLFLYICSLLEVNLNTDSDPDHGANGHVLVVISEMLGTILNLDLYDKSHDSAYRQLLRILLISKSEDGYFSCLTNLIKLNHLMVEIRLEKILLHVCLAEIMDPCGFDDFMTELVILYSKLRQMDKFITKLMAISLELGVHSEGLLRCNTFLNRFGFEVEMLPQGTAVEVLISWVRTLEEKVVIEFSEKSTGIDGFIQLLQLFISHVKVVDYTVTELNKKKVKDILVTMGTQLLKMVDTIVNNKQKEVVLYPVLLLMNVWGDVFLLMCQYTQHTAIDVTICQGYPLCMSAVYHFLYPEMIEKLLRITKKSPKCQFIMDMIHIQTLKVLLISCKESKPCVHQWNIDSPLRNAVSWNFKVSDLNEENYAVAKWKLFTDNFVLFWNDMSKKQVAQCAKVILDTVTYADTNSDQTCTFGYISRVFVRSTSLREHRGLLTALISEMWNKFHVMKQGNKKKAVNHTELREVFRILGDNESLSRNSSYIESAELSQQVSKVLDMSRLRTDFVKTAEEILSCVLPDLPLPYLNPVDQGRCFIGLMVVCYHGNAEIQKCCLPSLTTLVESSTSALKIIDLQVTVTAACQLFSQESIQEEVSLFVNMVLKSVCKEGSLLLAFESFVVKMEKWMVEVKQTLKKGGVITEELVTVIKVACLMILQFHTVIKRPYVREDIFMSCQKYLGLLLPQMSVLLSTVRTLSGHNQFMKCIATVFPVFISNSEGMNEELKKNFDFLLNWSIEQLDCKEPSEDQNVAVKFLENIMRDKLMISQDIRHVILDKSFDLLKKYTRNRKQLDTDNSTCDLYDSLLSLVSVVIVSSDIDQFKELLYQLELSMNIDLQMTREDEPLVCMSVWYTLLSSEMSEEQGKWFIQSVHNLTGYLTSLAQQLSLHGNCHIGRELCELQHRIMVTCPMTKQMILTMLGSVLLVPVTLETFPPMYEMLNEVLLNHSTVIFDIIPVFLNTCKHLLVWLVQQGDQDKLREISESLAEVLACVHQIDKLFTLISTHKEEFSKPVVYVVADYVDRVHRLTLLPVFKKALVSAIYKLLDISDKHILAQLHTVLNQGVKEVFRGLYDDYSNYYKYTGKI